MDVKKLITILAVVFVLFFLITQPGESATVVHNVLNWLKDGAQAIITFVKNVFA